VPFPGADGPGIIDALQHGDRNGAVWRPAEVDVSIRPGWFHHPAEDARVRSVENLVALYFSSVGRNGKLLLNVPPTTDGLVHATDVERLTGMRQELERRFEYKLPVSGRSWRLTGSRTAEMELDFGRARTVSVLRLEENITRGQVVAEYAIDGAGNDRDWKPLTRGTTIGNTKLDQITPVSVRRLRIRILDAVAEPEPILVEAY
jgi:alpha-L-fucosidase